MKKSYFFYCLILFSFIFICFYSIFNYEKTDSDVPCSPSENLKISSLSINDANQFVVTVDWEKSEGVKDYSLTFKADGANISTIDAISKKTEVIMPTGSIFEYKLIANCKNGTSLPVRSNASIDLGDLYRENPEEAIAGFKVCPMPTNLTIDSVIAFSKEREVLLIWDGVNKASSYNISYWQVFADGTDKLITEKILNPDEPLTQRFALNTFGDIKGGEHEFRVKATCNPSSPIDRVCLPDF